MGGVPVSDLPDTARAAWLDLAGGLRRVLGRDLVAVWAHGGTLAVEDGPHAGDLDTYVVVASPPDEAAAGRIEELQGANADGEQGVEWDVWYVLEADARRPEPPRHAFREGRRDTSWAIHRAHWLAGRYALLHGAEPADIVPPPTWADLAGDLDRELEHLERHVVEGDTDPFEATYAILNGSRILHAVETGNVVISKRAAGTWGLAHLPARWHATVQAAIRAYEARPSPDDVRLLAAQMGGFVAFVRAQLPATAVRRAEAPPRWSGN